MFIRKLAVPFLLILLLTQCREDKYAYFPVIRLYQNENKKILFTNKATGVFISNSHNENENKDEGWAVEGVYYLEDYRIYLDSQRVHRDSLIEINYYPFSLIRKYSIGLIETFSVLDSANILLWEIEYPGSLKNLEFELVLHQEFSNRNLILSTQQPQILIPPPDLSFNSNTINPLGIGASISWENKNRATVLCVLEKSQTALKKSLNILHSRYLLLKEKRILRIKNFIERNQLYTNLPDVTDAVTWAQISLDALTTKFGELGIRSGLPRPYNFQGRETFISLTSALLITGKYQAAKSILNSFGKHQLKEAGNLRFGRIPMHVSKDSIYYNSAEVTWWYIRAIYEYLLYTNDIDFISNIFPVVENAISGALRYRMDTNFFLLHDAGETWMNGGLLVYRGNRAVEVQAHWYAALQIAAQLARVIHHYNLSEHWLVIASTLQENFQNQFWNSYNFKIYDFLSPDGSRDKKVRPNQIFTVTTTKLPNINDLISFEAQSHVTNTVVKNLTYRNGVSSLWQKDKDYIACINLPAADNQLFSPYNGMIWNWLSGPIITSLLAFHQSNLAFELFYNQGKHILERGVIGNFSQLQTAFPCENTKYLQIFATGSHASSLAGFVQNFYHDFIGYQPNAPDSSIIFRPKITGELNYISAILPFKDNRIRFEYSLKEDDGSFVITISRIYGDDPFDVKIEMPGFDSVQYLFNKEITSHTFQLYSDFRRSYRIFPHLDWYFAQSGEQESVR